MSTASIVIIVVNILLAVVLAVGLTPLFVCWERRVAGFIQDRTGPNRCHIGPFRLGGFIQSIADMFKLIFKEDFTPGHIKEKFLFSVAPGIVFICYFLTFAVIPFADDVIIDNQALPMQVMPIQLGMMWFLAFAGLSVYGIILGGYSSGSKYGFLSAVRSTAQVISYEAAMSLALVSMLLTYGTIELNEMVKIQSGTFFGFIPSWGIFLQPLAALIFIVCIFAETNRTPFDIAEGESEIVAGYHTEHSAMRFGLFQVSEFAAMSGASAIIVTLFFGGYSIPWLSTEALKANIDIIAIVIMVLIPIKIFILTKWMKKNNVWENKDDIRAKENMYLIPALWAIAIFIVATLGALLIFGFSENSSSIAVAIIQVSTFLLKFFMMVLVFMWVRWTLLRFRYDQLQMLGWKILLPLSLFNIFVTASAIVFLGL